MRIRKNQVFFSLHVIPPALRKQGVEFIDGRNSERSVQTAEVTEVLPCLAGERFDAIMLCLLVSPQLIDLLCTILGDLVELVFLFIDLALKLFALALRGVGVFVAQIIDLLLTCFHGIAILLLQVLNTIIQAVFLVGQPTNHIGAGSIVIAA